MLRKSLVCWPTGAKSLVTPTREPGKEEKQIVLNGRNELNANFLGKYELELVRVCRHFVARCSRPIEFSYRRARCLSVCWSVDSWIRAPTSKRPFVGWRASVRLCRNSGRACVVVNTVEPGKVQ